MYHFDAMLLTTSFKGLVLLLILCILIHINKDVILSLLLEGDRMQPFLLQANDGKCAQMEHQYQAFSPSSTLTSQCLVQE